MSKEACPPHRRHQFTERANGVVVRRSPGCLRCGMWRNGGQNDRPSTGHRKEYIAATVVTSHESHEHILHEVSGGPMPFGNLGA